MPPLALLPGAPCVATGDVNVIWQRAFGGETTAVNETTPWSATRLEIAVILTFPASTACTVACASGAEPPRASSAPSRHGKKLVFEPVPTPFTAPGMYAFGAAAVYGLGDRKTLPSRPVRATRTPPKAAWPGR
jgi:hypothetical protein